MRKLRNGAECGRRASEQLVGEPGLGCPAGTTGVCRAGPDRLWGLAQSRVTTNGCRVHLCPGGTTFQAPVPHPLSSAPISFLHLSTVWQVLGLLPLKSLTTPSLLHSTSVITGRGMLFSLYVLLPASGVKKMSLLMPSRTQNGWMSVRMACLRPGMKK